MSLLSNPKYQPDALPLGAVTLLTEYRALNPAQRKFIVQYINQAHTNGVYDAADAVRHAYGDVKNLDLRAYQMLRNKRIKKVLDLHFRRSGLETILADLQRAARKSARLKGGLTLATKKALAAFEAYVAADKAKSKVCAETSQEHDTNL